MQNTVKQRGPRGAPLFCEGNTEKQYPRTHVGILERVVASINSGVGEGGGSSDRGEERREREVREQ
jgi:hypothetical protein